MYICADHHTSQFDAWNLGAAGNATFQSTISLSHATDPAGIAIHNDSATLFISSEFSAGLEMVNATTLTSINVSSGPLNLAGVDVDQSNDIVYAISRQGNSLYAYDWNSVAHTLTLRTGFPFSLPGCSTGWGIAFDDVTGILWVADSSGSGTVRAYNTLVPLPWTEDTSLSFAPGHRCVDVTIDERRRTIYTVGGWVGSYILGKYDLATTTATTHNMGHRGCGCAVDEATGLVYTTDLDTDHLRIWNCTTTPFFEALPSVWGDIGTPAGLCIGGGWIPRNVTFTKTGPAAAPAPSTIVYDNTYGCTGGNLTNAVITDNLPPETTFVSCTGGGIYNAITHTVTWNLGTIPDNPTPQSVAITVTVNTGTTGTITNFATLTCNEYPPVTRTLDTTITVHIIPEVPLGTIVASMAMIIAFVGYIAKPKIRK